MQDLAISPFLLAALFFAVAFLYSSVGLGGGSSYTALMAIFSVNYLAIPPISLTLNLIVSSLGSFNFIRKRHASFRLILPFFITSIPMAYLGGSLRLPKENFLWVLLVSLIFVALRIYAWKETTLKLNLGKTQKIVLSLIIGSVLGLIAGIVGIGGGIYLVPIIIILGLGTQKQAATCGAIFISLNSLAGLIAQIQKNSVDYPNIIPLIVAVVIGGSLGSYLGASKLSPKTMEKILGVVILVAIIFLIKRTLFA